jgi:hypothetical protein
MHIFWAIILFLSSSGYAQTQDASRPAERSLWDHNGSMMYLVANDTSREFYYQKPRPGMLEAGAHPDDLLFKGQINDGQMSGIAYIFNAQCGQVSFHVKGPVLDNGGRIVLTGQAPRVGRNCQSYGEYTTTLEFRLLKTSEVTQLPPATAQTPIVEQPTPDPSPGDAAEGKLSNNSPAQLAQTRRTPWVENPWPKAPPSGVVAPDWQLIGTDTATGATAEHSTVTVRSRRSTRFHGQEPFSAIDYCVQRGAPFVLDIVLGHDVEIQWIGCSRRPRGSADPSRPRPVESPCYNRAGLH